METKFGQRKENTNKKASFNEVNPTAMFTHNFFLLLTVNKIVN